MKTRIAFVALSLAGAACTTTQTEVKKDPVVDNKPPPPPKEKSPQELFNDGVAAFDKGELDAAKAAFEKVAAKEPKLVSVVYNLGVVAEHQGRLSDAQKFYEDARKLDANHRPSLLNLGKVYRLQDRFKDAIALYEEALKAPGAEFDVALLNNLSVAYRLSKQYDKAEAAVRKVLSRTKDNPDAYKNLALIYFDQGNYRLAEFVSANAKKLDDKDPGVFNNLGLIYLKLDDRRAALGQFQKSVALSEKFAPGHVNLGAMALQYRDYQNAEKSFSKAIALDPTSYEAFLAYGYALDGQKGKDPKKGIAAGEAFEKVLALKTDHPEAICGAGWAFAADKAGWDKAVKYLEKCKSQTITTPQDNQLIDVKLKAIATMQKQGAAQPAPEVKEKPKPAAGGGNMLEKAMEEGAKEGGDAPPPAEGEKKPEGAAAPAPAPAEQKK